MKKKRCYIRCCDLVDADVLHNWSVNSGNSDAKCFIWKKMEGNPKIRNTKVCLTCVYNDEHDFCALTPQEERQVKMAKLKRELEFGKVKPGNHYGTYGYVDPRK